MPPDSIPQNLSNHHSVGAGSDADGRPDESSERCEFGKIGENCMYEEEQQ